MKETMSQCPDCTPSAETIDTPAYIPWAPKGSVIYDRKFATLLSDWRSAGGDAAKRYAKKALVLDIDARMAAARQEGFREGSDKQLAAFEQRLAEARQESYKNGFDFGYELGKIAGQAEARQEIDKQNRQQVAAAFGLSGVPSFAWSYLLGLIESAVEADEADRDAGRPGCRAGRRGCRTGGRVMGTNDQMIAALQRELGRVTFEKASIAAVAMQLRAAVVSQDVAEREAALEAAAQQGIWPWPWPAPTIDKSLVLELRQLRDQIDAWRSAQAAAITDVLAAATGDEPSFEDEMLKKITDAYAARLEMLPGCGLNEVVEDVAMLISMAPMHLLLEARSAAQRGPLPTIPMPGPGKLC